MNHVVRIAIPAQTIEVTLDSVDQWDEALGTAVEQIREHFAELLPRSMRFGLDEDATELAGKVVEILEETDRPYSRTSVWSAEPAVVS